MVKYQIRVQLYAFCFSLAWNVTLHHSQLYLNFRSAAERGPVATLAVPEVPQYFNLAANEAGHVSVSVITHKGQLHIFQQKLNGAIKKPMTPGGSLKITDSSDPLRTVPILTCYVDLEGNEPSIVTAYGSWLNLRFEKFVSYKYKIK